MTCLFFHLYPPLQKNICLSLLRANAAKGHLPTPPRRGTHAAGARQETGRPSLGKGARPNILLRGAAFLRLPAFSFGPVSRRSKYIHRTI